MATKKSTTKKPTKAKAGKHADPDLVPLTQIDKAKKAAKSPGKPKVQKPKRVGAIDAAIKVLAEAKGPMNCKEMIDAMAAKGYWSSPNGMTPAATLYSSILRDIQKGGANARFQKTERGKFELAKGA